MAENNCTSCNHKRDPQGGHCYMFREEPAFLCMQHPDRKPKRVGTIGHVGSGRATLTAALTVILAQQQAKDAPGVATTSGGKAK